MFKKLLLTVVGLLATIVVLGGIKALQIRALIATAQSMSAPPEAVTTAVVKADEWQPTIPAVGTLVPYQGVTVTAELAGKVVHIAFESGATVKAGDLLVQLDTSTEEAQLRSAEAGVDLSRIGLERARELLSKATISKSEFDSADAQFKQAVAAADNIRTTIEKKTVRAPFAGRLGLRQINLGQTLAAGTAIVSLQSLDPIYVDFQLPQQRLADLAVGLTVRVISDATPGSVVEGKITAINPEVATASRNVKAQATLANADGRLRAGMFANVEVMLPHKNQVLILPTTAILYAPYGASVYVVKDGKNEKTGEANKVVEQKFVRLGEHRGDFVAIVSGISLGDTVVSSGVFKLRNGAAVLVNNSLAPEAQLAPKPSDT